MKNVIFYFEPEWAFGSIHYDLSKHLLARGVNGRVLSWEKPYSIEEMNELIEVTDVFMSVPQGAVTLVEQYKVPVEKIIMVFHAVEDLHFLLRHPSLFKHEVKAFAAVSEFLVKEAKRMGLPWEVALLPIGLSLGSYDFDIPTTLETVGYASAYREAVDEPADGLVAKRGYLARQCAEAAGLDFRVAQTYHHSFVTMPGFYKSVDCIVIASTNEGACLPMIEAGAAGRLVITTPVGHWSERVGERGSETVPIAAEEFVAKTTELLKYYKAHPAAFRKRCRDIKQHAQSYSWELYADAWAAIVQNETLR